MRSVVLVCLMLISVAGTLNASVCLSPASAAADVRLTYRLKTNLQRLLLERRDLERGLDEIADQIKRLEHVRHHSSVLRSLDDLRRKQLDGQRLQQELLFQIKDVENDLRSCI